MTSIYRHVPVAQFLMETLEEMITAEKLPELPEQTIYDVVLENFDDEMSHIAISRSHKGSDKSDHALIQGKTVWYNSVDAVWTFLLSDARLSGSGIKGTKDAIPRRHIYMQEDLTVHSPRLRLIAVETKAVAAELERSASRYGETRV